MNVNFTPLAPARRSFPLVDVEAPELFRQQFPYSAVPRILFDGKVVPPDPAEEIWITDTTFRDGQQARPPYTPKQIMDLYDMMHRLGGPRGVIRQCEFFVYSHRDRQAVEGCLAMGHRYPEVTGWIRANANDFKIVKELGLKETGILTSVSDYHIFLKLGKTREQVMEDYLSIVKAALAEGIVPRCHFEDITRADMYGFCLPFAERLLHLSEESGIPIKIRLCDTMGYGVTYPGAVLPRSVPKLVHAFRRELGFPAAQLEWHGHNDFHKVHINGSSAWLYGASALNASLLGFGERTGNPPMEGAIMEYLALKGEDNGVDTRVITEIAEYFRDVIRADIPSNYPFVGADFNTTRAGIHADGIMKNPEIYNIFDTDKLLNRPLGVTVTDKSGVAGIAHWINDALGKKDLKIGQKISKRHPGVAKIYDWVMAQYAAGRTTGISPEEMLAQAKRHLPHLFESELSRVKAAAREKGRILAERISNAPQVHSLEPGVLEPFLSEMVKDLPFIQLLAVIAPDGTRVSQVHTQRGQKKRFQALLKENFAERQWFRQVVETGKPWYSDPSVSRFTDVLILTIAEPIRNKRGKLVGVLDVDFKFEELVKLINRLPIDVLENDK